MSYLAAPCLGLDVSSASLVAAFGALPVAVKLAAKFCVAWPFMFHVVNGVRYLATTFGGTLANKAQFIKIGWGVVGVSVLGAGWVAFFV